MVVCAREHGYVHGITQTLPATYLAEPTGAGKQRTPILMKRDRQHSGVLIECPLDPVAMVGIYVQIQDALSLVYKVVDDQDRVVDIAKARGLSSASMMETPCDVKSNAGHASGNQLGALKRCSRMKPGPLPQSRKDRVVSWPEAVWKIAGDPAATSPFQGFNVFECMKPKDLRFRCRSGFNQVCIRKAEKVVCLAKVTCETQPFNLKRMTRPVVMCKVFFGIKKGGFHRESTLCL
jgi:hypothetical protein